MLCSITWTWSAFKECASLQATSQHQKNWRPLERQQYSWCQQYLDVLRQVPLEAAKQDLSLAGLEAITH